MTQLETRQLGIEFERRLYALDPSFEIGRKLDTDTIYAYLNEAQRSVFQKLYNAAMQLPADQTTNKFIDSNLNKFVNHKELQKSIVSNDAYDLPEDFFSYLRSISTINSSYQSSETEKHVQNAFFKQEYISKTNDDYFDSGAIVRKPIAILQTDDDSKQKLHVMHDKYTTLNGVHLYYYRLPKNMSLFENVDCELPVSCFEELVETALQLYLTYAKGSLNAEKEQTRQKAKQDEEDEQ